MRVLITGADGFIGKNLTVHLAERQDIVLSRFTSSDNISSLAELVLNSDFIFHLAGVNRPQNSEEFSIGNIDLTKSLCDAIILSGRQLPVLYTSSIQAELGSPYGQSKLGAENALLTLSKEHGSDVYIARLPNVFGKWAKPNYNSVVATFCHNIAYGLPIQINDPSSPIRLVYVDDVIERFIDVMDSKNAEVPFLNIKPEYSITVGELSLQIKAFRESRDNLITEAVGSGLTRALYSTYLSYLPPADFSYKVPRHEDPRGVFVEMVKSQDSGQISFFSAHPGVTRGGHYHHSKNEKFLVITGQACFRFCHVVTGDFYELHTTGEKSEIVETVPGWTHDITNEGETEMFVALWANEVFDRNKPDTYASPIEPQDNLI